jgi:A/G-specific adenine glycosylase
MSPKETNWPYLLTSWYQQVKKDYPWRQDPQPYHVWVSEIMLQQTRIETVLGYYSRFMEAFPTIESLAEAPIESVLKLWEGLGYYSRARHLHQAAQVIVREYNGRFPERFEQIRALPGIGDYTAGAIAAIALGQPKTAIDGNVMRVTARLYAIEEDILLASTRKKVQQRLEEIYPQDKASAFVQGLMELGEQICLPSGPRCADCPLRDACRSRKENRTAELPIRKKKEPQPVQPRLVAIIMRQDRVLLHLRPAKGLLAGLWEYPAVDWDGEETPEAAFLRQIGLAVRLGRHLQDVEHVFSHVRWAMQVYEAELCEEPLGADYRWADPKQLMQEIMLPTAYKKISW